MFQTCATEVGEMPKSPLKKTYQSPPSITQCLFSSHEAEHWKLLALQLSKLLHFPRKQATNSVHPVEAVEAFSLQCLSLEVGLLPIGKIDTKEDPGS